MKPRLFWHIALAAALLSGLGESASALETKWPNDQNANGFKLYNLPTPTLGTSALRLQDVTPGNCILQSTAVNGSIICASITGFSATAPLVLTGSVLSLSIDSSLAVSGGNLQRGALTGAITAAAGSGVTAFGALAAYSALVNATGSSAVPAPLAAGSDGLVLGRFASALTWHQLVEGDITNLTTDLSTLTAGVASKVPLTRTLTMSGPLTCGGGGSCDLSADRTFGLTLDSTLAVAAGALGRAGVTGDVGISAGSNTSVLLNIPDDTPQAGDLLATGIAAPATPASGKGRVYFDSTSLNLAVKNASGTVNHGAQTYACPASQWARALGDSGATTCTQPAFSDISGAPPAITSLTTDVVATGPGAAAATIQPNVVTNAKAAQMAALTVKANATNATANAQDVAASGAGQVFQVNGAGTALAWGALPSTSVTGAAGGFAYFNGSGLLTDDPTNGAWDATNFRMGIRRASPQYQLHLTDEAGAADRGIMLGGHGSADELLLWQRSLGTYASPTAVTNTTYLGRAQAFAYGGSSYLQTGEFGFRARPGATISTTSASTDFFVDVAGSGATGAYESSGHRLPLRVTRFGAVANSGAVQINFNPVSSPSALDGSLNVGVTGNPGTSIALYNTNAAGYHGIYWYSGTNTGATYTQSLLVSGLGGGPGSPSATWWRGPNDGASVMQYIYSDTSTGRIATIGGTGLFLGDDHGSGSGTGGAFDGVLEIQARTGQTTPTAIALTGTWDQLITKKAGNLTIGTTDAHAFATRTNGVDRSTWSSAGVLTLNAYATAGHVQTNGSGVVSIDTATYLADPGSNGLTARTASGVLTARTLVAGDSSIAVTNGDGVAGNPSLIVGAHGVTGAKFRQSAASTLVGNATGSTADVTDITMGAGCSIAGGSLTCSGSGVPTTRTLTTTAPLTGGGDLSANRTLALTIDSTLAVAAGALGRAALTGDATAAAGSNALTLAASGVTAGSCTYCSVTFDAKGRATAQASGTAPVTSVTGTAGRVTSSGGTTPVIDLATTTVAAGSYTNTNLTVDAFGRITAASNGSSGGGGTISAVTATSPLASSGGTTPNITLNANGVTDSFLRQGVASSVIGRSAASTGNVADIQCTADGNVLWRSGTTLGCSLLDYSKLTSLPVWPAANDILISSGTGTTPTGDSLFTYSTASHFLTLGGSDGLATAIALNKAGAQNIEKRGTGSMSIGLDHSDLLTLYTNGVARETIDGTGVVKFNAYGGGHLMTDASGVVSAHSWPSPTEVVVSVGTLAAPTGDANFTYDTTSHKLTLAGGVPLNLPGLTGPKLLMVDASHNVIAYPLPSLSSAMHDYAVILPSVSSNLQSGEWFATSSSAEPGLGITVEYPNNFTAGTLSAKMDVIQNVGVGGNITCNVTRNGSAIFGTTMTIVPGSTFGLISILNVSTGSVSASDTFGLYCIQGVGVSGLDLAFTYQMVLTP